jgi:alkylation response protein AidB-like acyl-CoA dehydrogenase
MKKPGVKELIARASAIGRLARNYAEETEKNGVISSEMIAKIRDADLFRVLQPARFGGFEYGYETFVQTAVAISAGDGSIGWVYSLAAVHQWVIGCFPDQAQHDVWDDDPNAIATMPSVLTCSVISANDGIRITGRWRFASGCDITQWAIVEGPVPCDGGRKEPGFFLIPKSDYKIEDNWSATGLAGTGSKIIVIDEKFVPNHRRVLLADLRSGSPSRHSVNTTALYRQPFFAVVPTCFVAPQIGMARGALQIAADLINESKMGVVAADANSQNLDFDSVAEVSACIDAAELLIRRGLREAANASSQLPGASVDLRLRNRRDHAFSVKLLVQAVDALFDRAGGSSLEIRHPLQRFWRDIHAAAAHASINWNSVGTMYGQHLLGLEPDAQY